MSIDHAFRALEVFISEFHERDGQQSAGLVRLLSFIDTSESASNGPADPAMWGDWLDALSNVRKRLS